MTRSTDTGGTPSRTHHWASPTSFADAGGRSGLELHVGRMTATAEARVVGAADGKVYAHATTTCAVFALPDAANGARMTV